MGLYDGEPLERLDLLGDPADIRVTRAVQDEIRGREPLDRSPAEQ